MFHLFFYFQKNTGGGILKLLSAYQPKASKCNYFLYTVSKQTSNIFITFTNVNTFFINYLIIHQLCVYNGSH